ncbi:AsmA family protein [Neisseria animaloris]|uniref:AsmA family protein n=1 Tax=Neisseria animaloris TaxID=326522 RepID=UPI000D3C8817|nr:AsmA family protein [Neisseria animaloris]
MICLPRSGKFWLRFIVFGGFIAILLIFGFYASLLYVFSSERIHALADESVAGTGRSIRFSDKIGRNWLPRPTIVLRDVVLSKPDSSASAVHIEEMSIGLAWSGLWNRSPIIEKWVVKEADAEITRRSDGSWSLRDLWKKSDGSVEVNRLVVENSRLNINLPDGSYHVRQFGLNVGGENENSRVFHSEGTVSRAPSETASWKSNGTLRRNGKQWELPALNVEAQAPVNGETATVAATADLVWQPQANTLYTRNLNLRADSSWQQLHLTARSPLLLWKTNHLTINKLSGVFTAGEGHNRWDGSLSLTRASLRPGIATVSKVEFNGGYRTDTKHTTFNISGPLIWRKNKLLQSENLLITSHLDNTRSSPNSRLISRLNGNFSLVNNRNWTTELKGLFDRQPVTFSAAYTAAGEDPAKLTAQLNLQKLTLAPYWSDFQAQAGNLYPALLNRRQIPNIEAGIKIGSLTMPNLQVDDLQTLLYADSRRIALTHFRAGLYGGTTEGGISIANTTPPSYHLQQNAQGVQIRPLLQDLLGYHNISGTGDAVIDLTAQGNDRNSLTKALNGSLQLNVSDGSWMGVDMNNILQSVRNNTAIGGNGRNLQTPFRQFSLTSDIRNGVGKHINAELLSDSLKISSNGQTDLNTQTVSENVLIQNIRNPEAKPVPLKISGPVNNPSVTIDFNRLTSGLNTPEEKQRALAETLKEQWLWLNPR